MIIVETSGNKKYFHKLLGSRNIKKHVEVKDNSGTTVYWIPDARRFKIILNRTKRKIGNEHRPISQCNRFLPDLKPYR